MQNYQMDDESYEWAQAIDAAYQDSDLSESQKIEKKSDHQIKEKNKFEEKVKMNQFTEQKIINQQQPNLQNQKSYKTQQSWNDEEEDDGWGIIQQDSEEEKYNKVLINEEIKSYKIEDIQKRIPDLVKQANEVLCLDNEDKVIQVLRHFQWDQAKIEEEWFSNQEKLNYEIGNEYDKSLVKKYPEINDSQSHKNNNTCSICYLEFDNSEQKAVSLKCGHEYCDQCWSRYLADKVKSDGSACVFTKCPQLRCNLVVPHSFFLKHLKDQISEDNINYYQKYINWHCRQYTDQNRNIKWCPQQNCDYCIEIPTFYSQNSILCDCKNSFCRYCENEDHAPVECSMVKQWLDKEKSDQENLTWIKANTKACPQCGSFIEKNQGCNHMTCKKCKHEFCWLCMNDWKKHGEATGGAFSCNIYQNMKNKDQELIQKEKSIQEAKNEIQRYLFHFERYQNHSKSRQICLGQFDQIQKGIKLLHDVKKYPMNELEFFIDAANIIQQCRQVLKWTYVLGYFFKIQKKSQIQLFEHQQMLLEEACEQTHKVMESDINRYLDISVTDRSPFFLFKANLTNLTAVLKKQLQQFTDSYQE